jgi:hypothetical protein
MPLLDAATVQLVAPPQADSWEPSLSENVTLAPLTGLPFESATCTANAPGATAPT